MAVEQEFKGEQAKRMIQNVGKLVALAVATAIERQATALTPVDTGNLRGSITAQEDGQSAIVGTNVEYAPYVEYGTFKSSPQPYMRPAIDILRGRVPDSAISEGKREFKL